MRTEPEPRIAPPEDFCVTAGCGHEVYAGEKLFEWDRFDPATGRTAAVTLCPDCFDDRFGVLTREEKAELLGLSYTEVTPCGRRFG